MSRSALQVYGTQQVMTSSPVKLIALLYDKAIISLKEAIQAIENGEVEKRWKANNKAIEILTHLTNTLDHGAGGEIAGNLEQLYDFMLARLMNVDLKNDPQPAREVIDLLQPLRDAWHKLAEEMPHGAAEPASQAGAQAGTPSAGHANGGAAANTVPGPNRQDSVETQAPPAKPVNLSA